MIQRGEAPEGFVVITSYQTAGRGQRGNTWEARPGENLMLSLVLYPTFLPAPAQFALNVAVSLGVHAFFREWIDEDLCIKWPNDLYAGTRKLGGILIENTLTGYQMNQSVVGIGLNINQITFEVPTATSLRQQTGQPFPFDLELLLNRLLQCVETEYLRLRAGAFAEQKERYLRHLFRYRQWYPYRRDGRVFNGYLTDVSEAGQLVLETERGLEYFGLKEVEFVL
jgi:BirA family biotin operon repressor/biotin-[acetyl-CoA-carboxylase] ligase